MNLMDGKVVVVIGVANKRSIAWGITKALSDAGARLALNYQNERMAEMRRERVTAIPVAQRLRHACPRCCRLRVKNAHGSMLADTDSSDK